MQLGASFMKHSVNVLFVIDNSDQTCNDNTSAWVVIVSYDSFKMKIFIHAVSEIVHFIACVNTVFPCLNIV